VPFWAGNGSEWEGARGIEAATEGLGTPRSLSVAVCYRLSGPIYRTWTPAHVRRWWSEIARVGNGVIHRLWLRAPAPASTLLPVEEVDRGQSSKHGNPLEQEDD
jgi:hypothetical protein